MFIQTEFYIKYLLSTDYFRRIAIQNVENLPTIAFMTKLLAYTERKDMSSKIESIRESLILVVDDSKYMRLKIRQFLEMDGYTVVEAEDGEQALSVCELLQPDLILMDCVMPVMDGFTACAKFHQLPGYKHPPVIMITSLNDDNAVNLAFESGAHDYITKPIHWAVLRHRVRRILLARHTETSLDQSEAMAQSIINHAPLGIMTIDQNGKIKSFNPACEGIFGYLWGEAIGQKISMLIPDFLDDKYYGRIIDNRYGTGEQTSFQSLVAEGLRKDGRIFPAEHIISRFNVRQNNLFTVIVRDITEQKQSEEALRESSERYRALTENTYDLICELSLKKQFLYLSPNYKDILGYEPASLIGKKVMDYIHPEDHPIVLTGFNRAFEHLASGQFVYRFVHHNGELRWFESTGKTYQTATGEIRGVFVSRDITERQRYEETIRHQAFHDALTGLPNRLLFKDRLNLAMAHAKRNKKMLAVLFLDLDRFKLINDTLGHAVGDQLLINVSERLVVNVREDDTVARLGGDEFTILLPEIGQIEGAATVAHKILEAVRKPLKVSNHELYISTSIGVVVYPSDGDDAEALLKNADTAMYRAKEKGRNNYQLYTPAMNAKAFERLAMENSLRRALEKNEFVVFYQPKVRIDTEEIIGMEALVRWQHPTRGLVSPGEFIPVAEETGLIVSIGEWVLRTACTQNKAWQDAGYPPVRVAVNLSARQFQLQNLVETVARILSETGLDPQWLELEITESIAMQNAEFTIKTLNDLKEMGIQLSIDDFGTGYSSLSYLKRFPINKLKIDKSFVSEITSDPDNAAIASTVIVLGQSLKLGVIAEGVETREQYHFLKQHHCDEMQGYLFGKPMPSSQFESLLQKKAPRA